MSRKDMTYGEVAKGKIAGVTEDRVDRPACPSHHDLRASTDRYRAHNEEVRARQALDATLATAGFQPKRVLIQGRVVPRGLGDLAHLYRQLPPGSVRDGVLEALLEACLVWAEHEADCNCDAGPWPDHDARCSSRVP